MSISQPSADIAQRIKRLLDERQQHAAAITSIDETLARVGAALAPNSRPAKAAPPVAKRPAPVKASSVKSKRAPQKFALSGEQSILAFVKSKSNPIGREIETHWKAEGRKGRAANDLSKLVAEKRLKRIPLKGERGSRYALA